MSDKRIFRVRHTFEESVYRFPKDLDDMGEYMGVTSHNDITGKKLYIGDVVKVSYRGLGHYTNKSKDYSVVVNGKYGKPFVMGYGNTAIDELKLVKTVNIDIIMKTFRELDFIVGDEESTRLVRTNVIKLREFSDKLRGATEGFLYDETLAIAVEEYLPTISDSDFDNMRVSDIRYLIERTEDGSVRERAKNYLKSMLS